MNVVCFKWRPRKGYRSNYPADVVNRLQRMFRRHYSKLDSFICVTDDAYGLDPIVEVVPIWPDHADLTNPSWSDGPNGYRKLMVFHPDIAGILGERFCVIDLDIVITGSLGNLLDRDEDFVGWRNSEHRRQINSSIFILRAGSKPDVWTRFDPETSPQEASEAGFWGSDQAWISYVLGDVPMWDESDGLVSFRLMEDQTKLPKEARIVVFNGQEDPWSYRPMSIPWVKRNWQ